jgi:hypothetical protein
MVQRLLRALRQRGAVTAQPQLLAHHRGPTALPTACARAAAEAMMMAGGTSAAAAVDALRSCTDTDSSAIASCPEAISGEYVTVHQSPPPTGAGLSSGQENITDLEVLVQQVAALAAGFNATAARSTTSVGGLRESVSGSSYPSLASDGADRMVRRNGPLPLISGNQTVLWPALCACGQDLAPVCSRTNWQWYASSCHASCQVRCRVWLRARLHVCEY